ncbi:MAG: EF-P lysine aminoacylase GenX [Planctomycetes bacterium]|nr:EF-P lysine aminoacylase GenX [Planctomycetota bacterium]
MDFRPAAPLEHLRRRAEILHAARAFLRGRGVLEVETPVLCAAGAVDEHLEPVPAELRPDGPRGPSRRLYLVTSPEHSMKRLVAAGSGPIFQVTRAFRDGERGRLHNPEFTILEWYRPGIDHHALMDEVEALLRVLLGGAPALLGDGPFDRLTYRRAFLDALGFDPHRVAAGDLSRIAGLEGVPPPPGMDVTDRDAWLNLLLAARVEGTLGLERPAFIHDYPASQAALARLRLGDPSVAERFELYVRGVELANGYHELLDPREQERRFVEANARRRASGKAELPIDRRLLAALEHGVPACAGVAVGLDRVVMLAVGASSIDEVIAFPLEQA